MERSDMVDVIHVAMGAIGATVYDVEAWSGVSASTIKRILRYDHVMADNLLSVSHSLGIDYQPTPSKTCPRHVFNREEYLNAYNSAHFRDLAEFIIYIPLMIKYPLITADRLSRIAGRFAFPFIYERKQLQSLYTAFPDTPLHRYAEHLTQRYDTEKPLRARQIEAWERQEEDPVLDQGYREYQQILNLLPQIAAKLFEMIGSEEVTTVSQNG